MPRVYRRTAYPRRYRRRTGYNRYYKRRSYIPRNGFTAQSVLNRSHTTVVTGTYQMGAEAYSILEIGFPGVFNIDWSAFRLASDFTDLTNTYQTYEPLKFEVTWIPSTTLVSNGEVFWNDLGVGPLITYRVSMDDFYSLIRYDSLSTASTAVAQQYSTYKIMDMKKRWTRTVYPDKKVMSSQRWFFNSTPSSDNTYGGGSFALRGYIRGDTSLGTSAGARDTIANSCGTFMVRFFVRLKGRR